MRGDVPSCELKNMTSLNETLQILNAEPNQWRVLAGGTDLMVQFEAGKLSHKKFLSLWNVSELKGEITIAASPGKTKVMQTDSVPMARIPALTTYSQIRKSELMQKYFPNLCKAAAATGALAIQNRGTIAGNIANASPAADSAPCLLVYDAQLEIVSKNGTRLVDYKDFHLDYKKTILKNDEIISAIYLPMDKLPNDRSTQKNHHWHHEFHKVGARQAQAISKVVLVSIVKVGVENICEDIRLAVGSVAATPMRCLQTEKFLFGKVVSQENIEKAKEVLSNEITPRDDIRSTGEYRLQVAKNLLRMVLE